MIRWKRIYISLAIWLFCFVLFAFFAVYICLVPLIFFVYWIAVKFVIIGLAVSATNAIIRIIVEFKKECKMNYFILTSVIWSYSLIVTNAKWIQNCRYVDVAQHAATGRTEKTRIKKNTQLENSKTDVVCREKEV